MAVKRRDFLKGLGITTVAGLSGAFGLYEVLGVQKTLAAGTLQTQQSIPNSKTLRASRWAMVIDLSRLKTPSDLDPLIQACHEEHNVPEIPELQDQVKWIWTETYEHAFPVQKEMPVPDKMKSALFPILCNHCENPPCVRVCPTQATYKRKDGIVVMDYHRCVGCRFCMAACPFGARSFNFQDPKPYVKTPNPEFPLRTKGVVEKCTFCAERLEKGLLPVCVERSNGAILFGDLEDTNSEVTKFLSTHYCIARRPELGTGPSIYYALP
jgi:Fe-S-cluster-containing dehydrogenase component